MKRFGPRRKRWAAVVATGVLTSGSLWAGTAGASATGATKGRTVVPQGINPALDPAANPTGTTPANTPVTVSFVLKARNVGQLEAEVDGGWRGPYLSTAQFASIYGQSPKVIHDLESYLGAFGIASSAYSDNLDVTANGTAGQFNKALSILMKNYTVPGHHGDRTQRVYASKRNPTVPSRLSDAILSILGLTNYAPFDSHAIKAPLTSEKTKPSDEAIPAGELTPEDFVNRYHLAPVESAGALGQNETVGILTLASLDPTVPQEFWHILGLNTLANRISLEDIDGGAGPVSLDAGSDETTLDVEQSGAIAPQSEIRVYQAPNTDYGFVDAFYAAASDNVADSVSNSWGESETFALLSALNGIESPTYAIAFDEADLEMAAQGQSNFSAAGDQGAFDATEDAGTTNLAVDNPADSPYITAAGGTTLPGTQTYPVVDSTGTPTGATESVTIPNERTWSWDYIWPLYAAFGDTSEMQAVEDNLAGGGGGYSVIQPEPSYQQGVRGVSRFSDVNYLTPTDVTDAQGVPLPTDFDFNPYPTVSGGRSPGGRAVPDLSFDADPDTGYALYDPQFEALYGTDILQYGGTSFVSPQLNGTAAVLASSLGHRIGFWNPVIYSAATSGHTPFSPLDDNRIYGSRYFSQTSASGVTSGLSGSFSNNNLYFTGTPGTVYNPASGLGFANLTALRSFFAHHGSNGGRATKP